MKAPCLNVCVSDKDDQRYLVMCNLKNILFGLRSAFHVHFVSFLPEKLFLEIPYRPKCFFSRPSQSELVRYVYLSSHHFPVYGSVIW